MSTADGRMNMIKVLIENQTIELEMNGGQRDLLEEAGNMILELINGTGETVEERHEFGVMLLSGVVGTFMQEQIDGEYDEEKAEELIASAFKFIVTNINLNKNKDKITELLKEMLLGDEPDGEPAQEEAAEAECDNVSAGNNYHSDAVDDAEKPLV